MSPRKLGEMPWGETAVLLGIWLGLAAFIVPRVLIGPTAGAVGAERAFTDIGNSFEKAAAVAEYADLRLVRAAAGNAVPIRLGSTETSSQPVSPGDMPSSRRSSSVVSRWSPAARGPGASPR